MNVFAASDKCKQETTEVKCPTVKDAYTQIYVCVCECMYVFVHVCMCISDISMICPPAKCMSLFRYTETQV